MIRAKLFVTGDFVIPALSDHFYIDHLKCPANVREIANHLSDADYYIVGGPEYIGDWLLDQAESLKGIVVLGTGTSSFVDLDAARHRNVWVSNTPHVNADAVAEFALGSLIGGLTNAYFSYQDLMMGGWYQKPHKTLSEATIGIVGLGEIGGRVARKIRAISTAPILYFSRTRKRDLEAALDLVYDDLENLAQRCDAMVIAVPYTSETHHMIGGYLLADANRELVIMCVSSPRVIDPDALRQALLEGRIRRCFIDGYYQEWTENAGIRGDPQGLLELGPERFVATSHIAAQSHAVLKQIVSQAFRKVIEEDKIRHSTAAL